MMELAVDQPGFPLNSCSACRAVLRDLASGRVSSCGVHGRLVERLAFDFRCGSAIRRARHSAGFSLSELAERIGQNELIVHAAETGWIAMGSEFARAAMAACDEVVKAREDALRRERERLAEWERLTTLPPRKGKRHKMSVAPTTANDLLRNDPPALRKRLGYTLNEREPEIRMFKEQYDWGPCSLCGTAHVLATGPGHMTTGLLCHNCDSTECIEDSFHAKLCTCNSLRPLPDVSELRFE